ncbi:hypothetical protein GCM10025867_12190 [Frondihabitans sucicola]|uniref:2-phosphosulfolactate phosphatase n=1 Tax=Frondihabitans sucicola TaxID=1268041 RepID=A0ABM8GKR4_9MICO|nr:hypothetical protein [Frondihabitans sucicola]BDZ48978.1 hypothetical protein GCM10025867_12190 [Frondihabitans sucicola]
MQEFRDQGRYQVRFEWGEAGAKRIAHGVHAVVVVDELDGHGDASAAQLAAGIAQATASGGAAAPAVLCATEASAADAASVILRLQERLGDRCIIALVGAGSVDADGFRTAVEDHLAAGAVVDALAEAGIDSSSPEAAAACASWQSLRRATGHLLTASTSARRSGEGAQDARAQRAAHPASVAVLREFSAPA